MGFGDVRGAVFKGACSQPRCPSRCSTGAGTRGCAQPALGIRADTGAAAAASGAHKPPQQPRGNAPGLPTSTFHPSSPAGSSASVATGYCIGTALPKQPLPGPRCTRCRRAPLGCSGRKRAGSSAIICTMSCYCRLAWR